jgi:hypothetical protein
VLERVLRTAAIAASLFLVASFVMFAVDELTSATDRNTSALETGGAGPMPTTARQPAHGSVRKAIDDVAQTLRKPFAGVVNTSNRWVTRGVPTALGLLVYGFGLGFLARYSRGRA